jgi:putative hydrolase of the HAD superfamily
MQASKPTWSPPKIDWSLVGAIVFDLGNVLIDLDNDFYGKGWPAGINEKELASFKQWVAEEGLWLKYEKGELSTDAFLKAIVEQLQLQLPQQAQDYSLHSRKKQVTKYWNRILLGIQPKRFDLLEQLQQRFPLYVLSNTNDLHIEWVRKHVAELGVPDFETRFFEQIFYSYEVGAVKPEPAIYAAAEGGIDHPASQILFIDDRPENIDAAHARGWQAVLLPPEVDVELVFKDLL